MKSAIVVLEHWEERCLMTFNWLQYYFYFYSAHNAVILLKVSGSFVELMLIIFIILSRLKIETDTQSNILAAWTCIVFKTKKEWNHRVVFLLLVALRPLICDERPCSGTSSVYYFNRNTSMLFEQYLHSLKINCFVIYNIMRTFSRQFFHEFFAWFAQKVDSL